MKHIILKSLFAFTFVAGCIGASPKAEAKIIRSKSAGTKAKEKQNTYATHTEDFWIAFRKAARFMSQGESFYELNIYSVGLLNLFAKTFLGNGLYFNLEKEDPKVIEKQIAELTAFQKVLNGMKDRTKTENAIREDSIKTIDGQERTKYIYKFGQIEFDLSVKNLKSKVQGLITELKKASSQKLSVKQNDAKVPAKGENVAAVR